MDKPDNKDKKVTDIVLRRAKSGELIARHEPGGEDHVIPEDSLDDHVDKFLPHPEKKEEKKEKRGVDFNMVRGKKIPLHRLVHKETVQHRTDVEDDTPQEERDTPSLFRVGKVRDIKPFDNEG